MSHPQPVIAGVPLDTHDRRIRFFELMLEGAPEVVPELPLPEGYSFVPYRPGDRAAWIAIEQSAKEFASREEGEEAWERYYGGKDAELRERMWFVADARGEKVATATAFYNIHLGDDGVSGWLHWVAVRRDAQGLGLSKPLISHVTGVMRALGYRRIVIPTQTYTWLACKVYLDLGFRPIPKNAVRCREGWEIVRRLTGHPALKDFKPAPDEAILVSMT